LTAPFSLVGEEDLPQVGRDIGCPSQAPGAHQAPRPSRRGL